MGEKVSKSFKESGVLVGFNSGLVNLPLEFGEGVDVGAFAPFQKSQDAFDFYRLKLIINGVQVVGFVFPELQLDHRSWVVSILEGLLGFQLKHVLYLLCPCDNASFKNVGLVLLRSVGVNYLLVGEGEEGPAFGETNHNIVVSDEVVEPFHEILGDQVRPALLVVGVLHDWADDLIADIVHVLEKVLGHFEENDVVLHGFFLESFLPNPQDDEA